MEFKKIFRLKNIIFAAIFIVLFFLLGAVFQPYWPSWNNSDTPYGFYKQPKNTIETVFVGSSMFVSGIAPTELYERYGICSYSLATEQQPALASYYWVKEAYRLHGKSMKTVVAEVFALIRGVHEVSFYHKATDNMRFSKVKSEAVREYSDFFEQNYALNLFPLLSYHERWKEFINKGSPKQKIKADSSTRGYAVMLSRHVDGKDYNVMALPQYYVNRRLGETEPNEDSLRWFIKLIEFCDEKNLRLVLIKTPRAKWTSADYNTVRKFADEYNLDFFDYNFNPYFDEIEFNFSYDTIAGGAVHLNYYGATKLTRAIGKYLKEKCGSRDVRKDPNYAFMKKELAVYKRRIAKVRLNEITDSAKYIEYLVKQKNYAVFATVNGDFKGKFGEDQKKILNKLGLKKLAKLSGTVSYMSVLDNGKVIAEIERNAKDKTPSELYGTLSGSRKKYLLTESKVTVGGASQKMNENGLTFSVYDNRTERFVDRVMVNNKSMKWKTRDYAARLKGIKKSGAALENLKGVERKLYLYDLAAQKRRAAKDAVINIGTNEILRFIKAYKDEEGIQIFISAKGKADGALSEETRQGLKDIGLSELSQLTDSDSYAAVIENGAVKQEKLAAGNEYAEIVGKNYSVYSGKDESDEVPAVKIKNAERSLNEQGLNVVVYDPGRETVVDRMTFF